MRLTITIDMDNAAFEDAPLAEAARILAEYFRRIGHDSDPTEVNNRPTLRDINGNTVGNAAVITD